MRRLFNLKMINGNSVVEHINEFNSIISQCSSIYFNIDNEVRALLCLRHGNQLCPSLATFLIKKT